MCDNQTSERRRLDMSWYEFGSLLYRAKARRADYALFLSCLNVYFSLFIIMLDYVIVQEKINFQTPKKLKGYLLWNFFPKNLTMPKKLKGMTLWDFSIPSLSQNSNKN